MYQEEELLSPPDVNNISKWLKDQEQDLKKSGQNIGWNKVNPFVFDNWASVAIESIGVSIAMYFAMYFISFFWNFLPFLEMITGMVWRVDFVRAYHSAFLFVLMYRVFEVLRSMWRHYSVKKNFEQSHKTKRARLIVQSTQEYRLRLKHHTNSRKSISSNDYEKEQKRLLRAKSALECIIEDWQSGSPSNFDTLEKLTQEFEENLLIKQAMQELDGFLNEDDQKDPAPEVTLIETEVVQETTSHH